MEPNKILSAKLIDLIFDGRNKEYGAYDLRNTYSKRTKTALFITIAATALAIGGVSLANNTKKKEAIYVVGPEIKLSTIKEDKSPEKLPEPERQPEPEQPRTQRYTAPIILPDPDVDQQLTAVDDSSRIDVVTTKGNPDTGIAFVEPPLPRAGDVTGIIQPRKGPEEIKTTVDVPAKFNNWKSFLERNLNPEVAVENGAPAGRYSVVMQFVVDTEGMVSEIKALTAHGYGLEQEAIRVLKKAPKWQPAILAGYAVTAYQKQVIVFEVIE